MIAEPSMPARRPSPGLTLNLSSNNPFRNRASSPAAASPALSTPGSGRPQSRNPFLTAHEDEPNSPQLVDMSAAMQDSPKKATFGNSAEELFANLTFDDKPVQKAPPPRVPPGRSGTTSQHRPSRSDEDKLRPPPARGPPRPRGPPTSRRHPDSPERRENRRPRRNSESSMADKGSLDPAEERKRRERRKERDTRSRREGSRSHRVRKPGGLDLIDKLDVSGIYGPSMFHHDGPFDACNPHRNRKKDQRAPMQAFPLGSANNALGGSGPLKKNIDLDTFHGRGAEGFTDFSTTAAVDDSYKKRPEMDGRSISFNPTTRVEPVHGDESYGLGTSTFLEGAPASRTAIERRELESEQAAFQDGGLGRKKSIAQRIRGISQPRRGFADGNARIMSPEGRYPPGYQRTPGSPPEVPAKYPQSAGGPSKMKETNPFFDDYDDAYEKKGAAIKVAETGNRDGMRSPSSPLRGNGLVRSMTADSGGAEESGKSGFLSRVKSLKGGKRRPERPS